MDDGEHRNNSSLSDHKGLLRSAVEILLSRATVAVLSLLFLIYFVRELPKPVLGLIGVHAAIVVLTKILIDLGLHFQVIREATPLFDRGRDREAIDTVIAPATLVRLFAAAAITLLIVAIGYLFIDQLQQAVPAMDLRIAIPFACAHIFFKNCQLILGPIFFSRQKYWLSALLDSGSAASEKIFAFILYLSAGTDYFFAGMMIGELVTLLLCVWFLRDVINRFRPHHFSPADAGRRLREYWPRYQRLLFRRGFRELDRVLVAALLSLSQMANYHVARQGAQVLAQLASILADPLTVRLAAGLGSVSQRRDRNVFYAIVISLSLVAACLSPVFVRILGGDAYADTWPIMALLSIAFLFNGLAEYQLSVIVVLGNGTEPVRQEAIAGIAGLCTTAVMVSWLGEIGAPFGQMTSFVLLYLLGRLLIRRVMATRS